MSLPSLSDLGLSPTSSNSEAPSYRSISTHTGVAPPLVEANLQDSKNQTCPSYTPVLYAPFALVVHAPLQLVQTLKAQLVTDLFQVFSLEHRESRDFYLLQFRDMEGMEAMETTLR